eukprot:TRINITY_DN6939_c0_g1_i2.p1 TRINITY_DN6939_c0_g1~~TRINITY_DN6939_c0_g1_i2.p1  ORF type:complete len:152 (-),score=25.98 TRINITY_DN6939_c0_g1_i2:53-508(-)
MGALLSWLFSFFTREGLPSTDPVSVPETKIPDEFPNVLRFCETSIRDLTQDDTEMQVEFIDAYFESTEEELAKLEAALAANDTQNAYIKSHSIKGAARYVAEHAYKLEMLGRDGRLVAVRAGMPALKQELQETETELRKYKDWVLQEKKHN